MKTNDWIVIGPAGHLASCTRCGGTVPHPAMPMEMGAFARYLREASEAHAKCAPAEKPKRIQRQRSKGWRMPDNARYVGRPGPFGNPYAPGMPFNDLAGGVRDNAHAVELYRELPKPLRIEELRGFDLACWCALDEPCHADVLLEWANE